MKHLEKTKKNKRKITIIQTVTLKTTINNLSTLGNFKHIRKKKRKKERKKERKKGIVNLHIPVIQIP